MYRVKRAASFSLACAAWAVLTAGVAVAVGLSPVPALIVSLAWVSLGAY